MSVKWRIFKAAHWLQMKEDAYLQGHHNIAVSLATFAAFAIMHLALSVAWMMVHIGRKNRG